MKKPKEIKKKATGFEDRDLLRAGAWSPPVDRPRVLSKDAIFIPGHVPSAKNSKLALKNGAVVAGGLTGKYIARYREFYQWHEFWLKNLMEARGLQYPVRIGFYLVRNDRARFDYHNAIQVIADMGSEAGIWPDDSCHYTKFIPLDFHVNRNQPGVWLDLLDD